jgi:hypothetical protein
MPDDDDEVEAVARAIWERYPAPLVSWDGLTESGKNTVSRDSLRALARTAIAALDVVRGDGWLPIDDDAKMQGQIQLTDGGYVVVGFWNRPNWMFGWHSGEMTVYCVLKPTHWRPLPAPPAQAQAEGMG